MACIFGRIYCLPLFTVILIILTFFTTYSIAVALNHVYPFWPYISDTGTKSPESCIFGMLLNISSVLLAAVIYVRNRQVTMFIALRKYIRITEGCNTLTTIIGYLSVLGLNVVANFQETNQFLVHIIGAIACFALCTVYFFIQCVFTYRMEFVSRTIFWLRVISTCLNVIFFIMVFAPVGKAGNAFKGQDMLKWEPKDGGYEFHLISTVSEWALVASFCSYVFTFSFEFRRLQMTEPEIKLSDDSQFLGMTKGRDSCSVSQWV